MEEQPEVWYDHTTGERVWPDGTRRYEMNWMLGPRPQMEAKVTTEHFYATGNLDAIIKAARLAKEATGNEQMIHRHTYAVACDDTCREIEEYA
jgi:hypothetical protein